jgi:hypothetical protein
MMTAAGLAVETLAKNNCIKCKVALMEAKMLAGTE